MNTARNRVRVGVIGVGRMGANHCRIYSNLRHTRLVGICDTNPERGNEIARKYDVPYFNRVSSLLSYVDAVSIATPTPAHFELAMHCLRRGVHVLVEKPITENLEQANELLRAAEASDRVVMVGHIERFNPAYLELKKVVEDLTPLAINIRRLSPYQVSNTDVDVVMDLMTHDVDLVHDLTGREPDAINAFGLQTFSGAIDHASVQLQYEPLPLVTLTASRVTEQKIRSVEVTAKEAYLEADLLHKSISVHRRTIGEYLNQNHTSVKYRHESIVERILVPPIEPLHSELEHFINCILEGRRPLVTAQEGTQVLAMVLAIRDMITRRLKEADHIPL